MKKNDFGNLDYPEFLKEIRKVLKANYELSKNGGYSAWVVKDYHDTKNKIPYIPFHSDLAKIGEEVGFKFHDLIVWDQRNLRNLESLCYPKVFFTNNSCQFIVIFRKNQNE